MPRFWHTNHSLMAGLRDYLGGVKLVTRSANEPDIPVIQGIVDSAQLSFDSKAKRLGLSEAKSMIEGFVDPGITRLVKATEDSDWDGFISLNPDAVRRRFYLDIYTKPGANTLPDSLQLAIELAREHNPEFQLWLGVNSQDHHYKSLLEARNFYLLRRYWTMQLELSETIGPKSSNLIEFEIREINLDNPGEVRSFWEVHQDSFSGHFGFVPRELDSWTELMLRDRDNAAMRVWLLSHDGRDVGFVDCDESMKHENAGYVSGLGVRISSHGKGFGEALLRHVIDINSTAGYRHLLLNVDAGNESGALRLYEKVGMRAVSEWHQYENVNWSRI